MRRKNHRHEGEAQHERQHAADKPRWNEFAEKFKQVHVQKATASIIRMMTAVVAKITHAVREISRIWPGTCVFGLGFFISILGRLRRARADKVTMVQSSAC